MEHQGNKYGSRCMQTVAQGTTLHKVRSVATLVEMEIFPAGNVLLVGHKKLNKLTSGFSLFEVSRYLNDHETFLNSIIQPGIAHSAKGILADVKSQVELACLGVAKNVRNQQTKNGIKYSYTQFWIDDLIACTRVLHKDHPERAITDIQTELLTCVHKNESDIYDPFMMLDGE